jgi:hypothetical protein
MQRGIIIIMNFYKQNIQDCIKKDPSEIVGWLTVAVKRANSDIWEQVGKQTPVHNTFTNAGRDLAHAQMYTNTSAGTRGCGYIAVSAEGTTPVAGDTTLASEISTNGLQRADATTKTHSNGTNTSVVEHTFTASGAHSGVHKAAMFNASSSGTMAHAANFSSDVTLATNDQLKVTFTLTLG